VPVADPTSHCDLVLFIKFERENLIHTVTTWSQLDSIWLGLVVKRLAEKMGNGLRNHLKCVQWDVKPSCIITRGRQNSGPQFVTRFSSLFSRRHINRQTVGWWSRAIVRCHATARHISSCDAEISFTARAPACLRPDSRRYEYRSSEIFMTAHRSRISVGQRSDKSDEWRRHTQ